LIDLSAANWWSNVLFAIAVLSLVLVVGNIFRKLLPLLVNHDVPMEPSSHLSRTCCPFSLIFTIPWGLLTAILLVYGRLSADNELIALRANGVEYHADFPSTGWDRACFNSHLPLAQCAGSPGCARKIAQYDLRSGHAKSDGAFLAAIR